MQKKCDRCHKDIPSDYQNLLCSECYTEVEKENALKKKRDAALGDGNGISDPNYIENPPVDELDLVSRMDGRFKGAGVVMPVDQRQMYESIKETFVKIVQTHPQYPKFIWNPSVIDIGCGLGIGANILSERANFVYAIDKSKENVSFAAQMFEREKNPVYWSPQLTFDVVDIETDPREFQKFDVITCIEVIEHLPNVAPLFKFIKKVAKPKTPVYISTPNRNAWEGTARALQPKNPHHVREYTATEFHDLLASQFSKVEILDADLASLPLDTKVTPIIARCYQ